MKPTCTTTCGRTQWARRRGRPTAFVNGGLSISMRSSCARRSSRSFVLKPVPILPANTNSGCVERAERWCAEPSLDPVATALGSDTDVETTLWVDPVAKLRTLTRPLPEGEESPPASTTLRGLPAWGPRSAGGSDTLSLTVGRGPVATALGCDTDEYS